MDEHRDLPDEAQVLGREIEDLFTGLRDKENFYLGRIASLEEQAAGLREALRKLLLEREDRERGLRERLAADAAEIRRLEDERGELRRKAEELGAGLASEKRASGQLERRLGVLQALLDERTGDLKRMQDVLERARAAILARKDADRTWEREIAERERLNAELKKELEGRDRRLALIVERLKSACRPPETGERPAPDAGNDGAAPAARSALETVDYNSLLARYDELNERLRRLEESRALLEQELSAARLENGELKAALLRGESAVPIEEALRVPGTPSAGGEEAGKYRDLLAKYEELGERLRQMEENRSALERELEEGEQQRIDLRRNSLRIQREVDLQILAAEEKMRRKDVEIENLRAALEKMKGVR